MIIELRGVGTVNKGAYLMLLSIIEHFKVNQPKNNITFVSKFGIYFPKEEGKKHGVKQLLLTKRKGIEFSNLIKKLPFAFREKKELYIKEDVDIILDGSGFAYGDQWSAASIKWRMSGNIKELKKNKVKIILMPQAFGPFLNPDVKKEVEIIIDYADLIFVRDSISQKFIQESFGNRTNVFSAPDFTNLLKIKNIVQNKNNRVLLIPNYKLIEKTEYSREYLINKFVDLIQLIQLNNRIPEFLIHEGKKDEDIANDINKILKKPLKIHIEQDAYEQKKLIGESYAVITGRFHGLVSALSQSVPSIALSWSHKYEMLLQDYSQGKFLINNDVDSKKLINEILDTDRNLEIREELKVQAELQKLRTEEMWKKVDSIIFQGDE